jgi:hypothetical protein
MMSRLKNFRDVLAMYRKHGWRLARVLARAETLEELRSSARDDESHGESGGGARGESGEQTRGGPGALTFEGVAVVESETDAMWFTRDAQGGREAWELRLVGETPYALFELFEADETEEDREDVRREMEARLRESAAPPESPGAKAPRGGGTAPPDE